MFRLAVCVLVLAACAADPKPSSPSERKSVQLDDYSKNIDSALRTALGAAYDQPLEAATAAQLAQGQAVYLQRCAGCHGSAGQGDGMLAAHLNPRPSNFTDPASALRFSDRGRMHIIKVGLVEYGAQMTAFGEFLDDDDLFAVYSYTKSLLKE